MNLGRVKNDILGKNYSLSLAEIPPKKSREINKKYRKKDKPTNVLAFPYAKDEGEILLCPAIIKKEAKVRGMTYKNFYGFLVIHAMLHLKGMRHGGKMEGSEKKYVKKYLDRDRRGIRDDAGHSG